MIFFYTTKQHKIMQVPGISTQLSMVSEKNMIGMWKLLHSTRPASFPYMKKCMA